MGKIREEKGPSPHPPKFEEVYPHYEFSELVRIAVLTAERLRRFLRDPRVQRAIAAGHPRVRAAGEEDEMKYRHHRKGRPTKHPTEGNRSAVYCG